MKETGVVRRFDELGRVVIPKEIRKRMKISSGDMVDIFVDENRIILEKYHPLNQDVTAIKALLDSLAKKYECEFIMLDKSRIIYSTITKISIGDNVASSFANRIENHLKREIAAKALIKVTDNAIIDEEMYMDKIMASYEEYGYLMIISRVITSKHKEVLELALNYLEHFLEDDN